METNRTYDSLKHLEAKRATMEYYKTRFQIILSHSNNKEQHCHKTNQPTNKWTKHHCNRREPEKNLYIIATWFSKKNKTHTLEKRQPLIVLRKQFLNVEGQN